MPLSEKWVITLSTQYGCPMRCNFCDVPNIKFNGNTSYEDMVKQIKNATQVFPSIRYTDRLNIHFARMGEPIFNNSVFDIAESLYIKKRSFQEIYNLRAEVIHPVLTTSLPKSCKQLEEKLSRWCDIKNKLYNGQAGLQFSINSTDTEQRKIMFNDMALSLEEFSKIADKLPEPLGRKYCLNIAYSTDFIVNASYLSDLFDTNKFMVKITPIHNNNACKKNNIVTENGYTNYYPYKEIEESLIDCGFDVLVFYPINGRRKRHCNLR